MSTEITPFEAIRRTNPAGNEFWSSRDFAKVLGYADYRNFQSVIESARTACFNSGQRVDDHFVEVTDMIEIGKGGQRPVKTVMMSRYAWTIWAVLKWPPTFSAPRRRRRNCAAKKLPVWRHERGRPYSANEVS